MKLSAMSEFHTKGASLFSSAEPVLLTKGGKVSGVYVPLDKPEQIPTEFRRKLAGVVGNHIAKRLRRKGVTSRDIKEDFRGYRKRRR